MTLSVYQVVECFLLGQLREGSSGVLCWLSSGGLEEAETFKR